MVNTIICMAYQVKEEVPELCILAVASFSLQLCTQHLLTQVLVDIEVLWGGRWGTQSVIDSMATLVVVPGGLGELRTW